MTDEELKRSYMLIHGHNLDVDVLKLQRELIDLAVYLANNEDFEKTGFTIKEVKPKLELRDAKVFLRSKFIIHNVSYANEMLLKLKLNGRIVRSVQDAINKYNSIGTLVDPFDLPVSFVEQAYFYGTIPCLTALNESDEFLEGMKLHFKGVELSNQITDITGVCYVHEIVHTQLESIKGIVKDFYNVEVLSIFAELMYAEHKGLVILKEVIKNRINLFFLEFERLYKYENEQTGELGEKWNAILASKYIVSTLKAFNLFSKYYFSDETKREQIEWSVQRVFSGFKTLEEVLEELNVTYDNSLDKSHVMRLIYAKKTP